MSSSRTIAALATPPGRGGVAVIRVSGPDAFLVAERLTGWKIAKPRSPRGSDVLVASEKSTAKPAENREANSPLIRLCMVHEGARHETRDASGGQTKDLRPSLKSSNNSNTQIILDTALVLAFRGPHSYTGEDVVEFQCHGGTVTPARVLAACFAAGATAARRGEFTERAFLNGKMDLSAAESVIELVDAKTERAADDALARLNGAKKTAYRALYDRALVLSAELEHALDVDEEELPLDFLSAHAAQAAALAEDARRAAGSADAGRLLRDGALVVLAGAPNAGKSSLLNALCGEDRAIVSPTPGTTRDTIEAWVDIEGWSVRLVDTAGLRETGDAIEQEGVRRAEALLAKADVIVALDTEIDLDTLLPWAHFREMRQSEIDSSSQAQFAELRPQVFRVHAKCDLDQNPREGSAAKGEATSSSLLAEAIGHRQSPLPVSSKTGYGLAALRAAIAARLAARAGTTTEDGATASERERALLLSAARQLDGQGARHEMRDVGGQRTEDKRQTLEMGDDPVLLANAARSAAETLGGLVGATYSDDLLATLFSRFCVGK